MGINEENQQLQYPENENSVRLKRVQPGEGSEIELAIQKMKPKIDGGTLAEICMAHSSSHPEGFAGWDNAHKAY